MTLFGKGLERPDIQNNASLFLPSYFWNYARAAHSPRLTNGATTS